ncbi:MAG TPA: glutathione S-transferase family protein [Thermoplasmata archaeon]
MPPILIYDEDYSPYCGKVRKLMDYKGLGYRRIPVPYHDKRRLLRETGQDYVPFLRHGRRGIPWTEAVDYLESIRPEPTAYPDGLRGVCKILEAWEYDWFEDRFWGLVAPFLAPRLTDEVERWNFEETWERVYGAFPELRRNPRPSWEALRPSLQSLEACLRTRPFLLADTLSAFDCAIYGDFHALKAAGVRILPEFPRLRQWFRRVDGIGGTGGDPKGRWAGARASR